MHDSSSENASYANDLTLVVNQDVNRIIAKDVISKDSSPFITS